MTDRVELLGLELRRAWPDARVEWVVLPSGFARLDVFLGERWLQLAYFPSSKLFGVDETTEDDAFSNYYRFTSPELNAAATELRRLISEAASGCRPQKAAS